MQKNYVTYEQFGAAGDGVTDDMAAIAACHAYANAHGLAVRAKDDAHYYIGGSAVTAYIMTDTCWGSARFTIDDRHVEDRQQNCFKAVSAAEKQPLDIKQLRREQKQLVFPHAGNAYVSVVSEKRKVYIRKGLNQDAGFDACDCFLVDRQGNIQNPINWDYNESTSAYAVSTDDAPIRIQGGIFTTIANREPSFYNYYERNLQIEQSHVTVRDCTWIPRRKTATVLSVIFARNSGDHDFGYPCGMPETITIDGLTVRDDLLPEEGLQYVALHRYDDAFVPNKPYPYGTPKRLIANIQRQTGKRMELYQNPKLFPYLKSE